ncbi:MAG: hypothetical protein KKA62_06020 [Nanoarchaeota archaeon]|nr:hypothetical protein [Nanoarchaeota archaeon]MBU1643810.1 hypothetical protein [Nanoarchaeota archaeon]MBU1977481.1 hypothetical protein [Nanoarchaeota archaeon]
MPTLIACLSTGKGTWTEVIKIINSQPWDKVFLITNNFGKENFKADKNTEFILIEDVLYKETSDLSEQIKNQLKGKISDFEIALNFVSGSGKEHMALLEAVLELGLNFRLVSLHKNQLEVLGLKR